MAARLPTGLWVQAHTARCSAAGIPIVVVRRGDPDRGVVIVKLNHRDEGVRVVSQIRDVDGTLVWSELFDGRGVSDTEADEYIDRQASYDPDIWVIEVENADEDSWFSGEVV